MTSRKKTKLSTVTIDEGEEEESESEVDEFSSHTSNAENFFTNEANF